MAIIGWNWVPRRLIFLQNYDIHVQINEGRLPPGYLVGISMTIGVSPRATFSRAIDF